MTLSDFVKEYRKEHDLSQRQFAAICGLSNGYISMLERNLNPKTGLPLTPSLPALKKISTAMGMSLGDLLTAVDDMPIDLLSDISEDCANELSALKKADCLSLSVLGQFFHNPKYCGCFFARRHLINSNRIFLPVVYVRIVTEMHTLLLEKK